MIKKRIVSQYGLKWNPFSHSIPIEGIFVDEPLKQFCWRVENLVMDGGFALISGSVGTGKSVALRWIASKLSEIEEVVVGEVVRPQSNIADFYRELGDIFQLPLQVSNRFASYKALREKWHSYIESTHFRPVLIIDEAQEMHPCVLSELRLISTRKYDSNSILTVILCGDERLPEKLRIPDLLPLGSRIRLRYHTEHYSKEKFTEILKVLMDQAGNASLMTDELVAILSEKSMGNYRVMIQMANSILSEGIRTDASQLDAQIFFNLFDISKKGR